MPAQITLTRGSIGLSASKIQTNSRLPYRATAGGWAKMSDETLAREREPIESVQARLQQTHRVYDNMALLPLALFARVIAMRIDAVPPFSALFTLWLSTMAAVGLASRSPCSRHAT